MRTSEMHLRNENGNGCIALIKKGCVYKYSKYVYSFVEQTCFSGSINSKLNILNCKTTFIDKVDLVEFEELRLSTGLGDDYSWFIYRLSYYFYNSKMIRSIYGEFHVENNWIKPFLFYDIFMVTNVDEIIFFKLNLFRNYQ